MLNEGIDVPEVNIVCFRGAHSDGFSSTTRPRPETSEGKSAVKVLDFVADIRRVAAGMEMNNEARKTSGRKYWLSRWGNCNFQ